MPKIIFIQFFIVLNLCFAGSGNKEPISSLMTISSPSDNGKYELGLKIFEDKRLSDDGTVSCSSCHNLATNGADTRTFSVGVKGRMGAVNSPSIFNSSLNFAQFWDGRARTLEAQIDGPVLGEHEFATTWEKLIAKMKADPDYENRFAALYKTGITVSSIKDAIVMFESQLITPNSKFDRFLNGQTTLTEGELRGYSMFKNFGCISCHQGVNVGGNMFQAMGIMEDYFKERNTPITEADYGRYNVTKKEADKFVFKVPSLRNVVLTPPYFHDGNAKTLQEAVRMMGRYQIGKNLSPQEIDSIIEFLSTLTGDTPRFLKRKAP